MLTRRHAPCLALSTIVLLLVSSGCSRGPTYPKAHLAESLQTLFEKKQLHASVRLLDHTLAVQLEYPNALARSDSQVGLGSAFDEVARKIIPTIQSVLLSSDAKVRFYVILLSDPTTPGAYLTIVRYLDDVRRAYANMIGDSEMFSRTLFDFNVVDTKTPLKIDQYVPRDIQLEEFLSWQLARRIQRKLIQDFQISGIANVGRCSGEFRNREFAFALNVVPATQKPLDEAMMRKVFQASTSIIAQVLSSYRFGSFDTVRLIHIPTGRNLVLPKTRLALFR